MMSVCRIAHSSLYHGNDVCASSAISYHKIRPTQNTPWSTSSCFTVYRLLLLSTSTRINGRSNYSFEATLISTKRLIMNNPPTTAHNSHRLAELCLATSSRPAVIMAAAALATARLWLRPAGLCRRSAQRPISNLLNTRQSPLTDHVTDAGWNEPLIMSVS